MSTEQALRAALEECSSAIEDMNGPDLSEDVTQRLFFAWQGAVAALALPPSEPSLAAVTLTRQAADNLQSLIGLNRRNPPSSITTQRDREWLDGLLDNLTQLVCSFNRGEPLPSPAVLKAADALAAWVAGAVGVTAGYVTSKEGEELLKGYRAARGPQPEQGGLIRGAEKV